MEVEWEFADFPDLPYPGMDRPCGFDELPFVVEFSEVWASLQTIASDSVFLRSIPPDPLPRAEDMHVRITLLRDELRALIDRRIDCLKCEIYGYSWSEHFLESRISHLISLHERSDTDDYQKACILDLLNGDYFKNEDVGLWTSKADSMIRFVLLELEMKRHYKRRVRQIREEVTEELCRAEKMFGRRSDDESEVSALLKEARQAFLFAEEQFCLFSEEEDESSEQWFTEVRERLITMYKALANE